MEWKLFEKELPTEKPGDQIKILFGHPKWATYMRGMYTHWPESTLRENLMEYKPDIDKYWGWESMMPTHWFKLPENPLANYKNGGFDGPFIGYNSQEKLVYEHHYKNGNLHGLSKGKIDMLKILYAKNYIDGVAEGEELIYS